MNIKNFKQILKRDYEAAEPPIRLRLYGWGEVVEKMPSRPKIQSYFWEKAALLIIITGFIGAVSLTFWKDVQAAMPGNLLYPVKRFSEDVIEKVTGDSQPAIDNRAKEIINIVHEDKNNSEELKKAVSEYKNKVTEAKKENERAGETDQKLEEKLEEHHQEFDKVEKEHPEVQKEIEDAKKISGGDEQHD